MKKVSSLWNLSDPDRYVYNERLLICDNMNTNMVKDDVIFIALY